MHMGFVVENNMRFLQRIPEKDIGLDHLEALVHHRRAVDGDLRAHVPSRVGEGLFGFRRSKIFPFLVAERPAGSGDI